MGRTDVRTAKNPVEMLLPVADHNRVLRFPPSFVSSVRTETTRRASDDFTTSVSDLSEMVGAHSDLISFI